MPAWPLPPSTGAIYRNTPGGRTAPTLSNFQFHYGGSSGITLGPGASVKVAQVEGLGGLPTVNSADVAFPRDTGEYVGVDAMGGRDILLDVFATSSIITQMSALGGAIFAGGVTEQPLWFQLPGKPTLCSMCRPHGRSSTWDAQFAADLYWTSTIALHATDPRLYSQGILTSSGSSGTSSVSFTVTNGGNTETRPVAVLSGPLFQPTLTLGTAANSPAIVFATGSAVTTGDQIVIDFSTPHTVQYFVGGVAAAPWNGGGGTVYNVYDWLDQSQTSWWTLAPGASTIVGAQGSGSLAADQFEVWHADAYLF